MKTKNILLLSLLLTLVLVSCQNSKENKEIPFETAKNYFVLNTIEKLENPKITDQESFENIFGMGTTMGEEGKKTNIDFSKEFVIGVVLPETQQQIKLHPKKLTQNDQGDLTFIYSKEKGEDLQHTIKPILMVVVDKKYEGNVEVKEE